MTTDPVQNKVHTMTPEPTWDWVSVHLRSAARLYNESRGDVKNSGSLAIFKKILKIHFFTKSFDFKNIRIEDNF